jgi:hypothetical protein
MAPEPDYASVFLSAALRAEETVARRQAQLVKAREVLQGTDWPARVLLSPPELQVLVLQEASAQAWNGRFGAAPAHLADLVRVRRLAAQIYAQSRCAGIRDVWFEVTARTANAYRIGGRYRECERILWRLSLIEEFAGDSVRAVHERAARRLGFLATLERARGDYAAALSLANRTIAKLRLLASGELGAAYARRCAIRLALALDLSESERCEMLALATRDVRRCLDHTSDVNLCGPPIASLALWLARTGKPFEQYLEYLDVWIARGQPIPEAISLRIRWARALQVGASSVRRADDELLHCYERFCALGRITDAGIVALDRIRLRLDAGVPLGIIQVVLEAKGRLRRAGLTPETNRVLDTLWLRVLQSVKSGMPKSPALGRHLDTAHGVLARE